MKDTSNDANEVIKVNDTKQDEDKITKDDQQLQGTDETAVKEEVSSDKNEDEDESKNEKEQRFLPSYKKPDAALTFPEKVRKKSVDSFIWLKLYLTRVFSPLPPLLSF